MSALLVPLVLLMNGLSAGVLVGSQLGGFPLMASLPPDRYVYTHAFFSTRYDPFMPICLVGTVVGDAALAVLSPDARALYAVGALLALITVLVSVTKNVPINKWVQRLDPERLPDGFDPSSRRSSWGRWNLTRSCLAVAALLANCVALGVVL
ncbi:hypothetical protein Lesp02_60260 [Lentzea sp. NBRC 105346]|uniref:DUF1772 domain-containing protein n=1 Tax=Lentzea sp. NBRC 105346 TaxID=3032205 RepID=UPI002557017F|nr:DUF1772 domain-containing protein [Lentzea sp. NBRC 105346]GLZ33838.1 hypothetical protein Lesp02_60260 [Lentzea sp. NBRC 105346]